MATLLDTFWSPVFWLPPNTTWADVEPKAAGDYTNYRHLAFALPLAVVVFLVRYVLERLCFKPFGLFMGVKEHRTRKLVPNAILEQVYSRNKGRKTLDREAVVDLGERLVWEERRVERWFRARRSQDKPSTLSKFCESSWRVTYYTVSTVACVVMLWNKPWFWDWSLCYAGHPHQGITADCRAYYLCCTAAYVALTATHFGDARRKDFWQMLVHHVLTVTLLCYGWITNFHRMAIFVLLVHDCCDIFLDAAKLAKYSKHHNVSAACFYAFAVVWCVCRCYVFPFKILLPAFLVAPHVLAFSPAYHVICAMLSVLMVLNALWTYMIIKLAVSVLGTDKKHTEAGDNRSSDSSPSSSSEAEGDHLATAAAHSNKTLKVL